MDTKEVCKMHSQRTERLEMKLDEFMDKMGSKVETIVVAMTANSSNLTNFFRWGKVIGTIITILMAGLLTYMGWSALEINNNKNRITKIETIQLNYFNKSQ